MAEVRQPGSRNPANRLRRILGRVARLAATILFLFWTPAPTFAELAGEVLKEKETFGAEETKKAAARQIARLVRNFGELRVSRITERHWTDYVAAELAKRSRKFYDDRKYMLRILNVAVSRRQAHPIRLRIPDLPTDAGRELEVDELRRLREAARADDAEDPASVQFQRSRDLLFQIDLSWKLGLRRGELFSLSWPQVNLERATIQLYASRTKTRKGRVVPIPSDLMPEFRRRRAVAASRWLFPNDGDTGPIRSNKTAWRRCKREAGVAARWNDLRHTAATWMLRAGVQPTVVKKLLGHSRVVLERIYDHLDLDDMKLAVELVDPSRPVDMREMRAAVACIARYTRVVGAGARAG